MTVTVTSKGFSVSSDCQDCIVLIGIIDSQAAYIKQLEESLVKTMSK